MTAVFDEGLTASEVLSRVYGYGLLHSDTVLADVSVQDRAKIVEAYEVNDVVAIGLLLEKQPDAPKKSPAKGKSQAE